MRRRTVLAGLGGAAGALLTGCESNNKSTPSAGNPGKLTPVTYQTGLAVFPQEGPFYYGKKAGYYADEGIDLKIVGGPSGSKNLDILRSGKVDITSLDSVAVMAAIGTGKYGWTGPDGIKMVGAVHQQTLTCISVLEASQITVPQQLAGKKIGYIPNGSVYLLFPTFAQLNKFDSSGIQWVITPANALGGVLASHKVDAVTNFATTVDSVAAGAKGPLRNFYYSDFIQDLYGNALCTTNKFLQSKPDVVKAFVRATVRALKDTISNPKATAQAFIDLNPTSPGGAKAALTEVTALTQYIGGASGSSVGTMDPTRVARMIAVLQGRGLINQGAQHAQPDDLVDFKIASS